MITPKPNLRYIFCHCHPIQHINVALQFGFVKYDRWIGKSRVACWLVDEVNSDIQMMILKLLDHTWEMRLFVKAKYVLPCEVHKSMSCIESRQNFPDGSICITRKCINPIGVAAVSWFAVFRWLLRWIQQTSYIHSDEIHKTLQINEVDFPVGSFSFDEPVLYKQCAGTVKSNYTDCIPCWCIPHGTQASWYCARTMMPNPLLPFYYIHGWWDHNLRLVRTRCYNLDISWNAHML